MHALNSYFKAKYFSDYFDIKKLNLKQAVIYYVL